MSTDNTTVAESPHGNALVFNMAAATCGAILIFEREHADGGAADGLEE